MLADSIAMMVCCKFMIPQIGSQWRTYFIFTFVTVSTSDVFSNSPYP